MDELKLLIEMVANLPTLAVWVLVGYLFYKIAVVGSVYGLARFAIDKGHNWLTLSKTKEVALVIDGVTWGSGQAAFVTQLKRITGEAGPYGFYMSDSHAEWLKAAIDDKIVKNQKAKGD